MSKSGTTKEMMMMMKKIKKMKMKGTSGTLRTFTFAPTSIVGSYPHERHGGKGFRIANWIKRHVMNHLARQIVCPSLSYIQGKFLGEIPKPSHDVMLGEC